MGLLVIFMIINFMDKAVLGVAVKPMLADLHLNIDQYGLISSSFFFLYFVSALLVGFAANRLPVRWILLVMAVVWSLAQFSILAAAGLGTVLASRIILGAAEAPSLPLANHAAYKWLPRHDRPLASSLLAGGAAAGILVGTFLTIALAGFAVYWSTVLDAAFAPLYLQDSLGLSLGQASAFIAAKQGFAIVVTYVGLGYLMRVMTRRGVRSRHVRGTIGGSCVLVSDLAAAGFALAPGVTSVPQL